MWSSSVDFSVIDESIEKFLREAPSEFIAYLKTNFERSVSYILDEAFRLEVHLILDSSSVLSDLISLAKRGKSILLKLAKEPYLRLFTPPKLKTEVERNIPKLSKQRKLDEQTLWKAWNEIFPLIEILEAEDFAMLKGSQLIGSRHMSDVPFVALHFQLGSHGIMTYDKDMIDQPQVRTWQILGVDRLVTVFKKGAFSVFIFSKILPRILSVIFSIGVLVLRLFLELFCSILQILGALFTKGAEAISKIPDWAKLFLGAALIILACIKETRDFALKVVQRIGKTIHRFASKFLNSIKSLLETLAPLVDIIITALAYLFNGYQMTLTLLRSLEKKDNIT